MNTRTEQHQRYTTGICIDCGQTPHSAGRPRCEGCHTARVHVLEPGLKRRAKGK